MPLIKARGTPEPSLLEQLRARIALDRHALDLAAEEQPQLFLDVADQHVMAQSRYDASRDALARIDAALNRELRSKLESEGSKVTEALLNAAVLTHTQHVEAAATVTKEKTETDEWGALRAALEHRKSMIRELATLYASGYYTAGAASGAGTKVRDVNAAVNRERLAKQRNER